MFMLMFLNMKVSNVYVDANENVNVDADVHEM